MKMYQLSFSPTGNTRKAADMLAAGFGGEWTRIDLTDRNFSGEMTFERDDLCIVAVPAFGGRVPGLAMEKLARMQGNGAKAVLMAVYGARAIDDTLSELQDGLEAAGFRCAAGVAALAEHSIMRQFATGRPNAEDADALAGFAPKIREKLADDGFTAPALPGNRPYKAYNGVPMKPATDEKCTACGQCAQGCPVSAIPADEPARTDLAACISCMRCIAICPAGARSVDPAVLEAPIARLTPICSVYKENELYL